MLVSFTKFVLLPFYTAGLILVTLYAVAQLHLLGWYWRWRRKPAGASLALEETSTDLPRVTVQVPMYNERLVVRRVIDCLASLRWPRDRLEIQVLDDSTDETSALAREAVEHWRGRGVDIVYLHRADRRGYKAGALAAGLERARGEFIAVFDADFRPDPDFLLRTIAAFDDARIGIVQARWGHANRERSLFTRIEALLLDIFFLVEQPARQEGGFFLRFNGSAGVWRRACIAEAGGWSADTLAEDLDLCYRAQLAGWRARYLPDVVAEAELPISLGDFRKQQFRWVRGTAQVVRKLGPRLLAARIPWLSRLHACIGLFNVIALLAALVTAVASVPVAWMLYGPAGLLRADRMDTSFALLPLFVWFLCTWLVIGRYEPSLWRRGTKAIALFFPMLATILGLTLSLSVAAVGGFLRAGGEFVRTPKLGAGTGPRYRSTPVSAFAIVELAVLVYFAFALGLDMQMGASDFVPMHVALVTGYATVLLAPALARIRVGVSPAAAALRVRADHARAVTPAVARWLRRHLPPLVGPVLAIGPLAVDADAQTSLVPAQHLVYDWLHRQRTLGRAHGYAWEALPLSRAEIAAHLAALDSSTSLDHSDRALLDSFLREFSREGLEHSANENIVRGSGNLVRRVSQMLRSYDEPHLFAAAADDYAFALDLFGSFGRATLREGDADDASWLVTRGVRAFADFYGHVGFHMEAGNIDARGDRQVLALDRLYGKTFEVVRQEKHNSNYFEASVSARYRALGAHIGHGAVRVGPGSAEPLFLGRDASKFDWIRLDVDTRWFRYVMFHGATASDAEDAVLVVDGDTLRARFAPQRWLAVHRMEFRIASSLRAALTEMIAYSARGMDYAYLNPVSPLFFSELDNHDRDNAAIGLDVSWRPVRGVELHGAVFVDDADDQGDLVNPSGGSGQERRAFDLGALWATPLGVDVGAGWVRLEPFVYTHAQRLNAFEQRGFPLGNPLGPNADATRLWTRLWLPRRTSIQLGWQRVRKGLNPLTPEGTLAVNAGGDLLIGSDQEPPIDFLESADVQRYDEFTVDGGFEPLRGVRMILRWERRDVRAGGRLADRHYFDLRAMIGF